MSLTHRLRSWTFSVDAAPASDLMDEAANEIERLRLTDAERVTISFAADSYALNDDDHDCWRIANALRSLLERTK